MAQRKPAVAQQVPRMKIISMGEATVGKSCLIKRYCEGKFVAKYVRTIGIDYGVKPVQVDGRLVHINFYDMAGSEAYYEIRNEFYADAQGAILVFDVTAQSSFEALDSWLDESKRHGAPANLVLVVCGNKIDSSKRVVSEKEAKKWAASHGAALYIETSTQDGKNVNEMFTQLFSLIDSAVKAA
uniref:RJL family GTPase n=1 Tax=Chrysotila carterae TaxID=13221 RepID=A0A7S4C1X5_CHRCT|mmetsp:Transcript_7467/g.16465  ORF Transcript_7467/g.16465 Transcript_7467/m.16465 type:complete len:184 (+) Transcript_7467:156-707(+)|eukprot:5344485-Pleurochrysis_carterae.AAC.10